MVRRKRFDAYRCQLQSESCKDYSDPNIFPDLHSTNQKKNIFRKSIDNFAFA